MWHPVHLGQAAASLVPCVIRARTCGQSGAIPVIDGHLWGARKAAYAALMPPDVHVDDAGRRASR
jgi:hypothetical protein